MKRGIFSVLLCALFVVSMVSVSFADQSFDRYGVRIRGIYVLPNEHFDGAVQGLLNSVGVGRADIDGAVAPELDLEYFATKNLSAELVLALVKHDIMVDNGGVNAGSVWLLPPSLLIKYHFMPDCKISPYVGFGMNVVMPFDEKFTVPGVGRTPLKIDTSVGWAAQIGADIPITKRCYFNIDAKYYDTETQMRLPGLTGATKYNLDVNPVIIGTGIGVRF